MINLKRERGGGGERREREREREREPDLKIDIRRPRFDQQLFEMYSTD